MHSKSKGLAAGLLALAALPALAQQSNRERNVYYGETHLHTMHPGGYEVKITKPLDWGAVTEHSDYMGMIQEAMYPDSPLRKNSPLMARALGAGVRADGLLAFKVLSVTIAKGISISDLTTPEVVTPVWKRIVDIADKYNEPGKFTTFAAFEWTSTPGGKNLHRNIFFRDSKKIPRVPLTSLDTTDPRDLWSWMDQQRAPSARWRASVRDPQWAAGYAAQRYGI